MAAGSDVGIGTDVTAPLGERRLAGTVVLPSFAAFAAFAAVASLMALGISRASAEPYERAETHDGRDDDPTTDAGCGQGAGESIEAGRVHGWPPEGGALRAEKGEDRDCWIVSGTGA
jgi:hypothetical protein